MILTEPEINKISGGSVDYFDRIVFARAIESAILEKLLGGVELPEAIAFCDDKVVKGSIGSCASKGAKAYWAKGDSIDRARVKSLKHPLCTIKAAKQYGAAQRLAGREQVLKEATDLDWTAIMCEGCLPDGDRTEAETKLREYYKHCYGKETPLPQPKPSQPKKRSQSAQ